MNEFPSDTTTRKVDKKTVTLSQGNNLSDVIDVGAGTPVMIGMPSTWEGDTITFQTSAEGVLFQDYYRSDGLELAITVRASSFIKLDPADFAGIRFLKIRSGTNAIPISQSTDRILTMVLRVL